MSEYGPVNRGDGLPGPEPEQSTTDATQAIPRFRQQGGYQQGVPGAPLPPIDYYPEREVERTRPMPKVELPDIQVDAGMSSPVAPHAPVENWEKPPPSPWHHSIAAVTEKARGNDETVEGIFASDPDAPVVRSIGEKVIIGLRRTVATAAVIAAVAGLGLIAREVSKLGQDHSEDDRALPAPTAPPLLPTPSLSSAPPSWSPSPLPSRTIVAYPAPTSARPSPSKTSASPSASPSPSPSASASETETASASPSPSDEVNTCAASGSGAETAICMPRGGTAYAYEWPPEQQKVVYSVEHGQVVRPECVNSSGWVLADYGDQAGYIQPNYFQQDDLRLIGQCAN